MKRIKIIINGVVTNQAELQAVEADAWLSSCLAKNKFGLPERWLRVQPDGNIPGEDISQAIDTRTFPSEFEGDAEIVEKKFAAQYEIVEEDMTEEINAKIAKQERMQALKDKHKAMKNNDLDTIVELRQAIMELQEILGLK
jgi:hypothetical protein